MKESALTREVLDALKKLPGVTAWRCNAGGYRGRMVGAPKGTPDVIGYLSNGRFFGIELKASHKDNCICAHCSAQRAWASRAIANRVLYVKARTVAEAVDGLTAEVIL